MPRQRTHVVWFKRDLRVHDHEPLAQAALAGPVLALYVHEPTLVQAADVSRQHTTFVCECLREMHQELQSAGGSLLELVGDAVQVLEDLWSELEFTDLWSYQETTGALGFARDKAVAAWARERNVRWHELPQNGVLRGPELNQKRFNFEQYFLTCSRTALAGLPPNAAFLTPPTTSAEPGSIPHGGGEDKPLRQRGGRSKALALMDSFFTETRLLAYPGSISAPLSAENGCSRLSPFIAYGVVSVHELVHRMTRTLEELENEGADPHRLVDCLRFFTERMYWRSSYLQAFERDGTVELLPQLVTTRGMREGEFNEEWFQAWKAGRTGVPMVDACMRKLAATGWIHMRARGMLMSFASNELWLHWREPALHLAREFLDYEPAIHWNQANIHGGTSSFSGPLTYNSVKQAQDHDPSGRFIRQWVPELAGLRADLLPDPWRSPQSCAQDGVVLGVDYPLPVTSVAAAHEAARQIVSSWREGRPAPALAYTKERIARLTASRQGALF